ncbi:MAG: hypothetical protein ACRD15_11360 [Vicinamibacterales bacterium]
MKALAVALFIGLAAQALPATLQIYAPATERGAAITVSAGSDLQSALDNASPGDVITLPPGATFSGNFVLPRKSGDRYITLRTASSDGLPSPGGRVSPEQSAQLAKIRSPNRAPAIRTAPGAHHWRLVLLEVGPTAGGVGDIVVLGNATVAQSGTDGGPHDLIIDRCYIHGDPERGQKRGIALNSASTIIIGSYISDIKSRGQDTQAIGGWSGPGPFRIENNYLEASGENFMLGGGQPAVHGLVPSDVVFRRNHVAKPAAWRSGPWAVKNLFELKNARRVLVEGNLFENNWVDAQPGYAIVLTPRGERGAAPWSTVEDVTFQYNIIRNTAAVFNLLGKDDAGESGRLSRLRIANNLIYGVDRAKWGGNGVFLQIGEAPAEVVVEHNTIVQGGNLISAYGGTKGTPSPADRFVFRNNLALHNTNGVIGAGLSIGTESIAAFFPDAVFLRNVLAGGRESRYPGDNLFPDTKQFAEQFVDFAGADYRLRQGSDFRRAASDGGDLGVNYVALVRAVGARAREWLGLSGPPANSQ